MHALVCLPVCLHGHIMYASNNGMTGLKENLSEEEYVTQSQKTNKAVRRTTKHTEPLIPPDHSVHSILLTFCQCCNSRATETTFWLPEWVEKPLSTPTPKTTAFLHNDFSQFLTNVFSIRQELRVVSVERQCCHNSNLLKQ